MKRYSKWIILTIVLTIIALLGVYFYIKNEVEEKQPYDWKDFNLIAHALGARHGSIHTNSKEAFIESYLNGFRVFEVDLFLTSDERLVAIHENRILRQITNEREVTSDFILNHQFFKEKGITPLSFEDIAQLMIEHPDIFLITDTKAIDKETVQKQFLYIYETANRKNPEILNRIIPQIYHESMLMYIEEIYSFKEYIWTLYQTPLISDDAIISFLERNQKITVLTTPYNSPRLTREFVSRLNELNVLVYIHTVNNINQVHYFFEMGVWGFFSNFITEDYLKRNELLRYSEYN